MTEKENDLQVLLRKVDTPYVVGMCDLVPPFIQQESLMAYFDKLGDKMQHLHIIDSDGTSDMHVLPGEGVLPLSEYKILMEKRRNGEKKDKNSSSGG